MKTGSRIRDYTILLKDVHLSDLHSFRLADIIISVVKWVFLWMVYEYHTQWLNAAWKVKLGQVLQLSKYWLAPDPVLQVNRWSSASPQDRLPSELTPVNCHSQVSSYSSHNVNRTNASSDYNLLIVVYNENCKLFLNKMCIYLGKWLELHQ